MILFHFNTNVCVGERWGRGWCCNHVYVTVLVTIFINPSIITVDQAILIAFSFLLNSKLWIFFPLNQTSSISILLGNRLCIPYKIPTSNLCLIAFHVYLLLDLPEFPSFQITMFTSPSRTIKLKCWSLNESSITFHCFSLSYMEYFSFLVVEEAVLNSLISWFNIIRKRDWFFSFYGWCVCDLALFLYFGWFLKLISRTPSLVK